jgi:hypothetical protein
MWMTIFPRQSNPHDKNAARPSAQTGATAWQTVASLETCRCHEAQRDPQYFPRPPAFPAARQRIGLRHPRATLCPPSIPKTHGSTYRRLPSLPCTAGFQACCVPQTAKSARVPKKSRFGNPRHVKATASFAVRVPFTGGRDAAPPSEPPRESGRGLPHSKSSRPPVALTKTRQRLGAPASSRLSGARQSARIKSIYFADGFRSSSLHERSRGTD